MHRRDLLTTAGGLALAGLAGCSGDGGTGDEGDTDGTDSGASGNEVAVGPGGSLTFDPASLTVSTGETVTWTFESATHNVSCDPEDVDSVSLPDGAEPFASYEDDKFATRDEGETFEHTFEVAGTYDYVCVPHQASMTGTITVEES